MGDAHFDIWAKNFAIVFSPGSLVRQFSLPGDIGTGVLGQITEWSKFFTHARLSWGQRW